MKLIHIITHPFSVIISFCLILISGDHWGGFYLMYLLMALPHGGIHAVLALLGTGMVLFSFGRYKRSSAAFIEMLLNILGVFGMYVSLLVFFYNSWNYNNDTFDQAVPLISIILFGILSLGFLINCLTRYGRIKPDEAPRLLT